MFRKFRTNFFRRNFSSNEISNNLRKILGLSEENFSSNRLLVPTRYLPPNDVILSNQTVSDLKWLMQKIQLRQDIFLIGPPSRYRNQLVLMMLELLDLEYEYVMLNRDTSESDLKQRKELLTSAMSSIYVDQCVVRAAANGRVLVLDGIEKAERNLLPIINNLVENREMQLEDGRFMLPEERYKKLTKNSPKISSLVPVHNDFRVICMGLPSPPFRGHSLDPPFRSRFQARKISHWPLRDQFLIAGSSVDQDRVERWISFANAMVSEEIQRKPSQVETTNDSLYSSSSNTRKPVLTTAPPYFPVDSCLNTVSMWKNFPSLSGREMIEFVYPVQLFDATHPGCSEFVKQVAKKFYLWDDNKSFDSLVSSIEVKLSEEKKGFAEVLFTLPAEESKFLVPSGKSCEVVKKQISEDFVETSGTRKTLLNMLLAHSVGDFCLVGGRGSGKTAIITQFARLLGYEKNLTTVMLYQDMTGRDLLEQRVTKSDGSTGWEFSPVIRAAVEGGLLVLDGIHVLNPSTTLVLKRLVEDREVFLPDGSRGLRHDRYDALKISQNVTENEMKKAGIFRIDPAFRLIATGEPPTSSKTSSKQSAPGPWLTPDINAMFLFVTLPPQNRVEELKILETLRPNVNETVKKLAKLDGNLLSLRQKLRILRILDAYPQQSLYDAVTSATLSRFMPLPARTALNDLLNQAEIRPSNSEGKKNSAKISISGNKLTVGDVSTEICRENSEVEGHAMRIPSVLFYDNNRQICSMAEMLKALLIGEHLLVIGNQGVGKNRIVDRLLELWARPRHYAQLHRDSTVQSLTVIPSVTGGRLHFEDSPLVKAVRAGHVLVLDEADKAPVHVTRVLKGLVESGNMLLPDGRRISASSTGPDVIPLHRDFRLIVLANPPGYPFLGNNFFASLGDLFSCHIVDNPDFESELELVKNYAGPSFDKDLLRRLTASFAELRSKANEGLLPYPYSTRELISVVKHLATFPNDSVNEALKNVFDFDSWNESALDAAASSFGKFGIEIERKNSFSKDNVNNKKIARLIELPNPVKFGNLVPKKDPGNVEVVASGGLQFDGPKRVEINRILVDQADGRLGRFSELARSFSLDLPENCRVRDATMTFNKSLSSDFIHLYTVNPSLLISYPLRYDTRTGSMIMLDSNQLPSPFLTVHPFQESITDPESSLLLFDSTSGFAATLSTLTGKTYTYSQSFAPMKLACPSSNQAKSLLPAKYLPSDLGANRPFAVSYRQGLDFISIIDFVTGKLTTLRVPLSIKSISPAFRKGAGWLLIGKDSKSNFVAGHLYLSTQPGEPWTASLELFETDQGSVRDLLINEVQEVATVDKERRICLPESEGKLSSTVYSILKNLSNETVELSGVKREKTLYSQENTEIKSFLNGDASNIETNDSLYLSSHSLLVSSLSRKQDYEPPSYQRILPFSTPSKVDSVLEIVRVPVNLGKEKATISHVPIEPSSSKSWRVVRLLPLSSQDVASVMSNGEVRVWEVVQGRIQQSLSSWQYRHRGPSEGEPDKLEKTISELLRKKADYNGPKHGKIDPENAPHVGGNQWAGGSGGRDTAGMGGSGGPYRLDSGNPIAQVPDWVKDQVPEHIKKAAREVAQRTYAERLKQIKMSKFDAELYERFTSRVRREVALLRSIIESLPTTKKERVWLKNQPEGDLDENKLIDGLTGEKSIYKRRVEPQSDDDPNSGEEKPRLLSLVVDVSGSMARFNSVDMRLEREAAAALMVMESLASGQGEQKRVVYDIYGHSGETDALEFCRVDNPPKNAKERLDILLAMQAHTMFCAPGDSTIQAIRRALSRIKRFHADSTSEKFVVLLSDANLSRYGIPASELARAMTPPDLPEDTRVFAIMIGSLGNEAESLVQELPRGQGYVCMDTASLPRILQQILTTTLLMQD